MQLFLCRIKPDGRTDISERALRENMLYYGLADIPGLLHTYHTLESIRKSIADIHPEYIPLREAKMFWLFSRTMLVGDLVLMPRKLPNGRYVSYCLAEVSGDPFADPAYADSHTVYRRPVKWLNDKRAINRERLPAPLITTINQPYNVRKTCVDISEFAQEVCELRRSLWAPSQQERTPPR